MGKKKPAATEAQAEQPHGNGGRQKPAHEVRLGRIRATVWENHSQQHGRWHSVTISRTYKEGETYKTASSFGRDDLLVVAEAARLAFLWVAQQQGNGSHETPAPTTEQPIPD